MRKSSRSLVGVVALALTLAACGGESGDEDSDITAVGSGEVSAEDEELLGGPEAVESLQELYAAATDAGQSLVTVYGPSEVDREPVYELFAQRFPGISVDPVFLVGPNYAARLETEVASGNHVADLVQSGDTSVAPQIGLEYFEPFEPVTAEDVDDSYRDQSGTVVAATAAAFGHLYNTNEISEDEAPTGWEDLLDERFAGVMATEDLTAFGGGFSVLSRLAWDGRISDGFVENLAAQDIQFESQSAVAGTVVATGQRALHPFYPLGYYLRDVERGAPVDFVFPTEGGVHLSPHYLALMDGAPNPDAAKLLMTWLFTPEGQQAAAEVGLYPLVPGEPGPDGYPAADELDHLKPFPLEDVNRIASENLEIVNAAFN